MIILEKENNRWVKNLITTIITCVLSIIIASIINYILSDTYNISVGNLVFVDNKWQTSITINNFENKDLLSFELFVPSKNLEVISDSTSISISPKSKEIIIISNILPSQSVTFFIASNNTINLSEIKAINKNTTLESDKKRVSFLIISYSVITGLLYVVTNLYSFYKLNQKQKLLYSQLTKKIDDRESEINQCESKINQCESENNQIHNKINRIEKAHTKYKIYYINKITDLSKELDFWKDTIRCLLYKAKGKTIKDIDIFNSVTEILKTYLTRDKKDMNYKELQRFLDVVDKTDFE